MAKILKYLSVLLLLLISLNVLPQQHVMQWMTGIGSKGWDINNDMVCDTSGNIYLTGSFVKTLKAGNDSLVSLGSHDMYISKFDSLGNLKWLIQAGDTNYDYGGCIKLFGNEKLLVTGGFEKVASFGTLKLSPDGFNTFLACYDLNGNALWVKNFPGVFGNYITSMATDSAMNIYLYGYFSKTIHFGNDSLISHGRSDIFLAKFNIDGNLIWLKQAGDIGIDITGTLIIDNNSLLITGLYQYKTKFNDKVLINSNQNQTGVFIARYNLSGELLDIKKIGEAEKILYPIISVDKNRNVYLGLSFGEIFDFKDNKIESIGNEDIFIACLTSDLHLKWNKHLKGNSFDLLQSMIVNKENNLIITGSFSNTLYVENDSITAQNYLTDIFISSYNNKGNLVWLDKFGGKSQDYSRCMFINKNNDLFISGSFRDTVQQKNQSITSAGEEDIFLAKYFNCKKTKIKITGDSLFCRGNVAHLKTKEELTLYVWNDLYQTGNTFDVDSSGWYKVFATDSMGCLMKDSMHVKELPLPLIDLGPDQIITLSQSVILIPDSNYVNYEWFDQSHEKMREIYGSQLGEGSHNVWLRVQDKYNCINTDTVNIQVMKTIPLMAAAIEKKNIQEQKNSTADENKSKSLKDDNNNATKEVTKDSDLNNVHFTIYPNPSTGIIYWTTDGDFNFLELEISDLLSNVVFSTVVEHYKYNEVNKINLQFLSQGTYYLKIASQNTQRIEKIVIQK